MTHNLNTLVYLASHIDKYYENAARDYDISGGYESAKISGNDLIIAFYEEGEHYKARIANCNDYTPEQLFNLFIDGYWEELPA